jgi:hypothetical protein
MKQFIKNYCNKFYNYNASKDFVSICATGGSGSSFLVDKFIDDKWRVCIRPDGGHQKANITSFDIYKKRTAHFFKTKLLFNATPEEMFEETYSQINEINNGKFMLMSMSWGGMGFYNNKDTKVIFLVRDPIYSFNSYSGGGWRSAGGERRINYVGATNANDKRWIDLWLNNFSYWKKGAEFALKAAKSGKGYLVRYHSFEEDWSLIPNVPPFHKDFKSSDNPDKYKKLLNDATIKYIRRQTDDIWTEIVNFKNIG